MNKIIKKEKKEKKILLVEYRRVSTLKQKEKNTIKRQEILNQKFIEMKDGKYEVVKVFVDDGKSGFKSEKKDRPNYNKMVKYIEENEQIDGVLVLEIDRLGRDSSELMKFKEKIKELKKCVVEAISGMVYTFLNPMQEFIFENMSSLSSFIGKRLKNKLQFMRKIAYKEHPEKFGRPKKNIPEKLKNKIIHWYKIQKNGFSRISKLIQTENFNDYPELQNEYIGFGKITKKEKELGKKRFYLSASSVGNYLRKWNIKIRPINKNYGNLLKKNLTSEIKK